MDGAAYRKSRIAGTVVVVAALIVVFLLGSWTLFLVVPLLAILLALHLRCPDTTRVPATTARSVARLPAVASTDRVP